MRNTTKFVSYKDINRLRKDLKQVYAAVDEQAALAALDDFDGKWSGRRQDWGLIHSQLEIFFADRITE